ncbi:MAG: DUF721 domain-containing protein [Kiritimatiellaeota bacterium]|nr:DUF721 domain-containing protein [Kiritimatiellota bacterium]
MSYDYVPGLSRRKTSRDRDPMPKLLEEWLGKKAAAKEIESRLPRMVPISEGIDQALKQLLTPELALFQKIKNSWLEIVGKALSNYLSPIFMEKTTLVVEVSHPAYMMTFGKQESELLVSKIADVIGKGKCVGIRLVPIGGTARKHKRLKKRSN